MLKRILVTVALIGVTAAAFGQGTVIFDNRNLTTGPAPVTVGVGGTNASGPAWSAQLYSAAGDQRANLSALTAAETRGAFRGGINAGFVQLSGTNPFTTAPVDQEVTVTSVANGPATIQMRAWDSQFSTYEAAVAANGWYGSSAPIFLAATGGGLLPAVELTGLQGFAMTIVPEPSTLALGALGLAALLFRRRK